MSQPDAALYIQVAFRGHQVATTLTAISALFAGPELYGILLGGR